MVGKLQTISIPARFLRTNCNIDNVNHNVNDEHLGSSYLSPTLLHKRAFVPTCPYGKHTKVQEFFVTFECLSQSANSHG
jgi:hypothetical protein